MGESLFEYQRLSAALPGFVVVAASMAMTVYLLGIWAMTEGLQCLKSRVWWSVALCCLLVGIVGSARAESIAATNTAGFEVCNSTTNPACWGSTRDAACSNWRVLQAQDTYALTPIGCSGAACAGCQLYKPAGTGTMWLAIKAVNQYQCPANQNWTLSGSTCTRPDCVPPQVRDSGTGQCVSDCPKGKIYGGWVNANANPALICSGNCELQIVSAHNQASVGGVQVIYGTWVGTGVVTCTGTQLGSAAGATQDPPCGYNQCRGFVNDQAVCVSCGDPGVTPDTSWSGASTTTASASGGSTTTNNVTQTTNNSVTTTTTNITTTTTNPGPGGGAASTTSATSPTMTSEPTEPDVQEPCGLPGTPPCKMDESGTPSGAGAYGTAEGSLNAHANSVVASLSSATQVSSIGSWWAPSLPSGGCSSIQLGVPDHLFSLDWCDKLSIGRELWGWFVAMLAALYAWRRATGAVGSQA